MRTIKILPLILAVVSITIVAKAQDINTCRPKAEHILTAAQSHKLDGIDELLAPDFRFSNIKQPVAAKVLKQIITQMPPVTGWEQAEIVQDSTGLKICYTITRPDSSTSKATILFNTDNQVVEADLLNADVSLRKATPTAKAQPEANVIRIPLYRYGGLPIVTVSIDGQPCNMFFDTGAPGIILNSKYFEHNIDGEVMGTGGRGAVGTGAVSGLHHVKSMDMSGLALYETDIMTSDLSNLEAVGIAVHGILGQSFYKDFDVLFDFKGGEIVLLRPDTTYQWLMNEGYHCQTVKGVKKGHLLTFDCQVGSIPVTLAFDSGAQTNLLGENWLRQHPSLAKGIKKSQLTGYGEGLASVKKGKTVLTLGNRTFKKLWTTFSDVSHFKESKGIDGLFGCDVLAKQKILISYKREELLLLD